MGKGGDGTRLRVVTQRLSPGPESISEKGSEWSRNWKCRLAVSQIRKRGEERTPRSENDEPPSFEHSSDAEMKEKEI